jgi:signal transduction histidine kinase
MGEMERLFREFDWSGTPIGSPEHWPATWRNAVRVILDSSFPTAIGLGPQLIYFYNDGFIPLGGPARHPHALGRPVREVWTEIWPDILQPRFSHTLETGMPTGEADLLMPLDRSGYLEETYISFSFAALRDDIGRPSGIFCTAADNTQRVIAQRQIDCLRRLAAGSLFAPSPEAACRMAAEVLEAQPRDIPFALFYLLEGAGKDAQLVCTCGLRELPEIIPRTVDLSSAVAYWPFATVANQHRPILISDTSLQLRPALTRSNLVPEQCLVLPIASSGSDALVGFIVAGLNPMRPIEETRAFHLMVAQQLETSIAHARANQQAEERTRELTDLNRAKTVFFSNVSHELRTPLTLLLSPIEQLQGSEGLSEADRKRLQIALRGGRRLLKLVDSLLQFSRAEENKLEAYYEPTDLAQLTADLTSMFRSLFERAGVAFEVECPPLGESVYVDPRMWEKIVLNLVSNAFKFTLSGKVRVHVRLQDDSVELQVADTGCGISEKDLPRLFERFFRGEAAHARSVEGTGIGLSLVKELVEAHHGCVSAKSRPGIGTTITVRIPRGSAHLPAERVRMGGVPAPLEAGAVPYIEEALGWLSPAVPPPAAPTGREEILVVDDNADMRAHLAHLLETRWRISMAFDGTSALKRIRLRSPDLVLSDTMMPGLNGFGLLHELRNDPATADIPVLLLSARAGEEASSDGLEAGADDYIVKPFSARDLIARIELHLARAKAKASAVEARKAAEEAGRARDEFFATLFHEIRTPLASLQTWIDLLRSNRLPAAAVPNALEALETSSCTLNGLVQDLLDYSAVVRGELRVEPQPTPAILPIVLPVVRAFQSVAQLKDLTLECTPMGSARPARVDVLRLQQVVWNLISNAIRHTPRGGRIDVLVANRDATVEIAVRDTGVGIPANELSHVFGRYWRGNAAGTGSPGLGLGLAIARRIVELHGGTITAHSEGEGRGATFTVRLPASGDEAITGSGATYRAEDAATRLRYAVAAAAGGAARQLDKTSAERLEIVEGAPGTASKPLRILLVEDDDELARACQRLLSSHGHRVVRANGCTGALRALNTEFIDVIISDVHLADGSAIELLQDVRDRLHLGGGSDRLPAVAMSAFRGQKEVARHRAAGFAAQIGKPFQESTLLRALREALRHGSLSRGHPH